YQKVLELDPSSSHASLNLAVLMHEQGHMSSAIEAYRACLQSAYSSTPPNLSDATMILNNLGAAQLIAGDTAGGVASFEQALSLDPSLPSVLINLGAFYSEEGNLTHSSALYERAYEIYLESESRHEVGVKVRQAIALPPIMSSPLANDQAFDIFMHK
ncbi:hypothetical protein TeGR_g6624, partial [Tetraparma gracilis]